MTDRLPVVESPMSFTGSAKRLWGLTNTNTAWLKWLVLAPMALLTISMVWLVIVGWYCLWGVLVVPWRLLRRGQRRDRRQEALFRQYH